MYASEMTPFAHINLEDRDEPLTLAWPANGNPAGFMNFERADDWRNFITALGINSRIPDITQRKFARAQTIYLLGWVDFSLIKAGELAALIALELALMDRYGGQLSKSKRSFAALLKHMVAVEGLTDGDIPMVARCGGTAIGQLVGDIHPTLAERRNALAHGDPFDGLPTGGLLELVRDLINFAYRDYIAEAPPLGVRA